MNPNVKSPSAKKIAIFGATSEIGGEIARRLAPGQHLILAGRRHGALSELARDLEELGAAAVECVDFDAMDTDSMSAVLDQIEATGPIDTALAMFGVLGDQNAAEDSGEEVYRILHTDFTAQAVLLTELSSRMKRRGRGILVAYSSIAGARVRRPNYVYGSAKAGLDGFCQGMQDALVGTGVSLIIVRPGFVIGRMTQGMDPAPMSTTPDVVADATVEAIAHSESHPGAHGDVWIPRRLKLLAQIMQWVPRWLWRRAPR
ncbi:SDR family NAD(P)-dependent oxidoreductase [Corynebacterium sp. 320]|uniref:SDR family NAD(P)-dependent oxidoreductase n=1 Tax=Corynebacterium TaxID=1716 RepID=UPI00125CB2F8|nr:MULTISPECIES: SDR family NAD(P)-dependent oxidoreductase [Corynebacterium]KAB1503622.1 SDR family NAD(P)-dependent oxidoreductase [Corynebacterium sp. 320]KAB1553277.1 SDR family NAD(P)-dependent oxidoreductase [Corynebacterium sp. 321]KAB1553504.1 SDR family NAD(P)-dependent oxidoreductase [Corynebacterium sp. 319]KAB3527758.1 SDR family NAD(P)-dependent oxidoreductase [Corynebacterium sp. 250]KAB3540753.1 SDR family NAD(P)-dependent oxidoreductase [Corynebacterium sp. 366]